MKKTRKESFGNVEFCYGRSDFSQKRQECKQTLQLSEKLLKISICFFSVWACLAILGSGIEDILILGVVSVCFWKFVVVMKGDIASKQTKYADARFQFLSLAERSDYVTCLFDGVEESFQLLIDDNGTEMRINAYDIADLLHIKHDNVFVDKSVESAADRTHKLVVDMSKKTQLRFSAIPRGVMFS